MGEYRTHRVHQLVLIVSTILGSWLGMQWVHESGHILGGLLTGGTVSNVALNPINISRTDLSNNPHPLFVVWSGPVFGVIAPLVFWLGSRWIGWRCKFVLQFFAGFCLVANGAYIGVGSFDRIGDCGEMLRHGSALWQLWLFGIVTVPVGFLLWHGLGRHFGLGIDKQPIDVRVTYASLLVCTILLISGFIVGD